MLNQLKILIDYRPIIVFGLFCLISDIIFISFKLSSLLIFNYLSLLQNKYSFHNLSYCCAIVSDLAYDSSQIYPVKTNVHRRPQGVSSDPKYRLLCSVAVYTKTGLGGDPSRG
ncbi:hypothetical protein CHS0354_008902 [Potamilus streckersoni]|uniref:Uncharacterized protein n=1 Tax=Potamilus streckersoni TaxID=2493646 RepID=A0AAE0W560_9BIVA|nr:hypothetical protein CHS0354_008902 [Potamilus streckersoni]